MLELVVDSHLCPDSKSQLKSPIHPRQQIEQFKINLISLKVIL